MSEFPQCLPDIEPLAPGDPVPSLQAQHVARGHAVRARLLPHHLRWDAVTRNKILTAAHCIDGFNELKTNLSILYPNAASMYKMGEITYQVETLL